MSQFLRDLSSSVHSLAAETQLLRERYARSACVCCNSRSWCWINATRHLSAASDSAKAAVQAQQLGG